MNVSAAKLRASAREASPGNEIRAGLRESLPVLLGVIPFGLTCGVMGITVGLTPLETILMSMLVFAGAAQFVSMTMLGAGITGWGILVLTTLLINLRHLLMGASLAPFMSRLPGPLQALLAFGIVDETYALTINRISQCGYSHHYQLAANGAFYAAWVLSTAAGTYLGGYIPDPLAWGLDFAMPAMFLALLAPRLIDRAGLASCAVAALAAVLGAMYLPGKWYIIVACVLGSITGGIMEGSAAPEGEPKK